MRSNMAKSFDDISRRDFIKLCGSLAAVAGLADMFGVEKIAKALEQAAAKKAVIWLAGQGCTGCTNSMISGENPSPASIIIEKISLRYHESIMAAAGNTAEKAKDDSIKEGGYILVVEGAIPSADDRFCMTGGRPFKEILIEAARKAEVIICAGACSSFGGIPSATPSRGVPVSKLITDKPVINLSTCPVHMDHIAGMLVNYIVTRKAPSLDSHNRPYMYFGTLVHDKCKRRPNYDKENFLEDWNDPAQKDWCLLLKGCKGPKAYSDCPVRRWNNGINHCLDSGAPCQGCSEPDFYPEFSPLYNKV